MGPAVAVLVLVGADVADTVALGVAAELDMRRDLVVANLHAGVAMTVHHRHQADLAARKKASGLVGPGVHQPHCRCWLAHKKGEQRMTVGSEKDYDSADVVEASDTESPLDAAAPVVKTDSLHDVVVVVRIGEEVSGSRLEHCAVAGSERCCGISVAAVTSPAFALRHHTG